MLLLGYLFLLFENVGSDDKFINFENWICLYDISDC
jgi:hypothetical protein